MTVVLALAAAVLLGSGVALQQHEARRIAPEESLRPGLLLGLLSRPRWLTGLVADIGGWGMQAWALAAGALIVVQPLIAINLVFALALASALSGQPLQRSEWMAVVATLVGLTLFLTLARPTEHSEAVATPSDWLILVLATSGGIGLLLSTGLARRGSQRAALFGAAAGSAEALMAVLSKAFADRVGKGFASSFASWEPYAVIGCGIITMLVVQSSYQVGQPTVALPVNTVAEPVLAATIGVVLFGEHLRLGGARTPFVVLGLITMAAGLVFLARTSAQAEPLAGLQSDGTS